MRGDKITFYAYVPDDPGAPVHQVWGPYTWSVYRDTLTFKKAWPEAYYGVDKGPTGFVVKPWHKVAA